MMKPWEPGYVLVIEASAVSDALRQCADEIDRNRSAIAGLRSALKLALKALPFSTHPDAFEAVNLALRLIDTTKETK